MRTDPPPHDRSRSSRRAWVWSALAVAAALAAVAGLARARAREPLPVLGQLPPFTLVERSRRPVSGEELRGRPWVAAFIFTRCGGACPAMTARMARLRRELPGEVALVSFTVDPAHDTPEVLDRYARAAGAGGDWLFLTGEREQLYRLAREGFKLGVEEVPPEQQDAWGDGPFLHSSHFVLVDRRGRVRGYYDSTEAAALESLRRDLAGGPS